MPADYMVRIPLTMPRDWSWIERIEEELLLRGILAKVEERTGWHKIDKDLIYDILTWRCMEDGESVCPAVVFEGEKAYLLVLDKNAEKYIKVLDLEEVLVEEIKGIIRYSDCLAKYGYDFPC